MDEHLYVIIDMDVITNTICYNTNIKSERLSDVLSDVLQCQVGAVPDNSDAHKRHLYEIEIIIDLSFDDITIQSNTGNKGLTAGILMYFLSKLLENEK